MIKDCAVMMYLRGCTSVFEKDKVCTSRYLNKNLLFSYYSFLLLMLVLSRILVMWNKEIYIKLRHKV